MKFACLCVFMILFVCGGVSAAPVSSYNDFVNEINNGNGSVDVPAGMFFSFRDTIVISKPVCINGHGLDVKSNGKFIPNFKVVGGGSLTLDNVTFSGGKDYAVEVDSGGRLYVDNSTFKYLSGGAVNLCNGGSAIINNSYVENGYGVSQIRVLTGSSLFVENSDFESNLNGTDGLGSCLYIYGNNIHINITNSVFKDNTATNGGVLYYWATGDGSEICLDNNNISDNNAEKSGGVLFIDGLGSYNVRLLNNNFDGNRAADGQGACIFTSSSGVLNSFSYYLIGNNFKNCMDDKSSTAMFLTIYKVSSNNLFYFSGNSIDGNGHLGSYINLIDCSPDLVSPDLES